MSKVNILFEKCNPDQAMDTSLPYTAYLVTYDDKGTIKYDITVSNKQADIFDHYYDTYKSVIAITQSNGKMNPKLWNNPKQPSQPNKPNKKK